MTAKDMFEGLNYTYSYIDNSKDNCENVIIYKNTYLNTIIQFNLFSEIIVYQIENKFKEYEKIGLFVTKELIQAINKQIEELGWND